MLANQKESRLLNLVCHGKDISLPLFKLGASGKFGLDRIALLWARFLSSFVIRRKFFNIPSSSLNEIHVSKDRFTVNRINRASMTCSLQQVNLGTGRCIYLLTTKCSTSASGETIVTRIDIDG